MKLFQSSMPLMVAMGIAVSQIPAQAIEMQPTNRNEVVMKIGSTVHLFHRSGDVTREICVGDVIPAYREIAQGGHLSRKQVGQVKVVGYMEGNYFQAEVVNGEVKVGDIAGKGNAECTVRQPR